MKIIVPTQWSEVTVLQFQQITLLDSNATPTERSRDIISILCDVNANDLTVESFNEIQSMLGFMNEDLPKARFSEFKVDGVTYEWIKSLNEITNGEQISIEQTIENEELNYFQSFDLIMAVLLTEKGGKFDATKINEKRDFYSSFPIDKVYGMILFFLSGGTLYSPNTPTCSVRAMKRTKIDGQMRKNFLTRLSIKKVGMTVLNGWEWSIGLQKMILQSMKKFLK